MFSNSSKYAIKAVLFLALNSDENSRIMVKDIAGPINVPQAYIAKLLQELSRQNVISSARGPKGGFYLSEKDRVLPIKRIINVIDGDSRITSCLLSLETCNDDKPCPLHKMAFPLRSKLLDMLETKTVLDLAEDVKAGNSFLPL